MRFDVRNVIAIDTGIVLPVLRQTLVDLRKEAQANGDDEMAATADDAAIGCKAELGVCRRALIEGLG